MTFSIPQPIPSRSSHPVHAHQRPPIRRSQSHTVSSSTAHPAGPGTAAASTTKFSFSHLYDHHLHSDVGDDLNLVNEEDESRVDEDEDEDEDDMEQVRHDSGHYADLDLSSKGRAIPIGKPSFHFDDGHSFKKTRDHLLGHTGGSVGSRNRLSEDLHSRGRHDDLDENDHTPTQHRTQLDHRDAASAFNVPAVSSSSTSITIPQRAFRQGDVQSSQPLPSRHTSEHSSDKRSSIHAPASPLHPNISIDTSKACLQKTKTPASHTTTDSLFTEALKPAGTAKTLSTGTTLKAQPEGQLALGLKKEDRVSPPSTFGSTLGLASNSSTRPLMMNNQPRHSSALPPTPMFHHQAASAFEPQTSSGLLPSLSPSSPRANSALVNSLEQLSVSWKAPEHTPSFPINRLHRSRTISSGTRPKVTAPRMAPDEEGEQVGDFIMGKIIGHGGFSLVREAFAIHLDGLVAQVAVKIVKTQTGATDNDRVQRMLDKEVAIWSRLSHPNVLPFLAVEKLPTDTFVFCELCTGGHLLDYITRQEASSYVSPRAGGTVGLEEGQARLIFNQIAEAVRYLHEEKRIVHRDIKLENILQHEDGTWKICDFGLAEYQNDEAASYFGSPVSSSSNGGGGSTERDGCFSETEEADAVGGSLAYCSPEQLRSPTPLKCPSSDVWSLGVVLYALLTGRLPFQDEYEPRLQYQILNGRYEDPTECSAEARDLLKNMFRSKPEDRWRIGQVMDSPWCMGTTLVEPEYGSGFGGHGSSHASTNNFFASFRA
ncbi:hypothetical protein BGZ72_004004 [Mortierella alpina]|nr:hypothetical protein BGZ72_004004 [Mortierella alpina]